MPYTGRWCRKLTVSFTILLSSIIIPTSSTCYYPGGQIIANDHTPCTNDTDAHCCAEGQVCLTNGLCLVTWDMSYWAGSCEDATWNSGLCFQSCKKLPAGGWSYSSPNIWHCFDNATQWACGNGDGSIANETCANGEGFSFEVGAGRNPRVQNGTDVFPDGYALVDHEALQSPSPPTSSSSPTSTPSPSSSPPPLPSNASCPTADSTAGTSEIQAANIQRPSEVSTGAAAGIGLGVGIPLLLWAMSATIIAYRRQRRMEALQVASNAALRRPQQYHSHGIRQPEELDNHMVHEAPANKSRLPELPGCPQVGMGRDTPTEADV